MRSLCYRHSSKRYGPLDLRLVVRESLLGKDKAGELMHSVEKKLLNAFLIVGSFWILARLLPVTKGGQGMLILPGM